MYKRYALLVHGGNIRHADSGSFDVCTTTMQEVHKVSKLKRLYSIHPVAPTEDRVYYYDTELTEIDEDTFKIMLLVLNLG